MSKLLKKEGEKNMKVKIAKENAATREGQKNLRVIRSATLTSR